MTAVLDAPPAAAVPRLGPRIERPAPLSSAQARLWFLHQLRPTTEYNLQLAFRLRGPLDVPAMSEALRALSRRHEPLRTVVRGGPTGQPVQRVLARAVLEPDLRPAPPGLDDAARVQSVLDEELSVVFDLADRPAVRARIAALGPDDAVLALTMHHMLFDGWSTGIVCRELAEAYAAFRVGRAWEPAPLAVTYSDYAWWERDALLRTEAELLEFWRGEVADADELDLPADGPGTGVGGPLGVVRAEVAPATAERLRALARAEGTTVFAVAVAAYQALLFRYADQTEFVVGTPAGGRVDVALEPLVGCFVNTLCLRARIRPAESFRALVGRTRDAVAAALSHQLLPFDRLVQDVAPGSGADRNPLFRAFCSYVDQQQPDVALDGLDAELVLPSYGVSRFDLNATFALGGPAPLVQLEYGRRVFDPATAERLVRHLATLLDWAAAQPDLPVEALPLMTPQERRGVLALLNGGR